MSDRLEVLEGDYVTDGEGNTGIVRRCFNKTTHEHYLRVFVVNGPQRKHWRPTSYFQPQLDHPGGTVTARCLDCRRPFKGHSDPLLKNDTREFSKEDKCRTCAGYQRTPAQRERDREAHAAGEYARKTKHHAR